MPKKDKTALPPIKPTWRTTGEYPLIAGTWWEWKEKGIKVTVTQHGNEFIATTTYQEGDQSGELACTEGKITKNGHITARLVHTQPHSPDQWKPQKRRAVLEPTEEIVGYAAWDDGGSEIEWTLIKPRAADTNEASR